MLFLLAFLTNFAYANEVVTLNKGDAAPFSGTLLSPEAAAKIIVDTDYSLQKCLIDSEKNLALQKAELDFQIKNAETSLAACTLKYNQMEALYEKQITFLEKQAVQPEWTKPLWFVGGVVAGIGIMYGSSVMLDNIGR